MLSSPNKNEMTNRQICEIAIRQSAIDMSCRYDDFLLDKPVIVTSAEHECARKYLKLPFACSMVSYGSNIVASVSDEFAEIARAYLEKYPKEHCFEPPHMLALHQQLAEKGYGISMTAEYWLPDLTRLSVLPSVCKTRLLTKEQLADLYLSEWSNAICKKRA